MPAIVVTDTSAAMAQYGKLYRACVLADAEGITFSSWTPERLAHAMAVSTSTRALRDALVTAMRALVGPDADTCVWCSTLYDVRYRTAGDIYVCGACWWTDAG